MRFLSFELGISELYQGFVGQNLIFVEFRRISTDKFAIRINFRIAKLTIFSFIVNKSNEISKLG